MLPVIAAAARAAGTAAKAASTASKAKRAVKTSDEIYNARRRYVRKAERYLNQAERSYGAAKERYIFLAKNEAERALATYESKPNMLKLSKGLQRVASETGAEYVKPTDYWKGEFVKASTKTLETKQNRREYMSDRIMSSTVGSRIIASLEPIWRDFGSVKAAESEIFAHLSDVTGKQITDWMDVIEAYESNPDIAQDLYKEPKTREKYDAVVQAAQRAFKL